MKQLRLFSTSLALPFSIGDQPSVAALPATVVLIDEGLVLDPTGPTFSHTMRRGGLAAMSVASVMATAMPDAQASLLYTVQPLGPAETLLTGSDSTSLTDAIGNTNSNSPVEYTLVGTTATRDYAIVNRTAGNTTSGTTTLTIIAGTPGLFSASLSGTTLNSTTSRTVTASVTPTTRTGSTIAGTFTLRGKNPNDQSYTGTDYNDDSNDNFSFTFRTQAVAPLASVSSTATTVTSRVGTSTVGVASVTVKNTGDGNLSGLGAASNLQGTVSSNVSALTGGGAVSLADGASQTFGFTYAPTARGSATATITTGLSNGNANGTGVTKTSTVGVAAVGPQYDATVKGSGAIVNGGTIVFGDYVGGISNQELLISNITSDLAASKNLTTLSLTSITITGSNEFSFSLSGFNSSSVTLGDGKGTIQSSQYAGLAGNIAIQFNNLVSDYASAQLRIQTDEGAALGGTGAIYIYNLQWTVPEPGTLMVLGTGLLGLAISRRRRHGQGAEAVRLTARDGEPPQG